MTDKNTLSPSKEVGKFLDLVWVPYVTGAVGLCLGTAFAYYKKSGPVGYLIYPNLGFIVGTAISVPIVISKASKQAETLAKKAETVAATVNTKG